MAVIRLGDEKTSLEFAVEDLESDGTSSPLDITNATDLTIRFKRQDGTTIEKIGSILGDGVDGIVQYITEVGFITEADIGTLQGIAIVTFLTTGPYHSSPGKFKVKDNF